MFATFGPQYWWPAGGSRQPALGGLPGAAAGPASGLASDGLGRGGIRRGVIYHARFGRNELRPYKPHGPPDSNAVFEVVVGAILTQNTAWTNVEKAIENLRSAGCLTPESLRGLSTEKLAHLLRPSGYFNVKAQRLKSFIIFLYQQY
ncbi:MAG: hypothetical protein ACREIQ_02915, partial [Nitrospiria bacterium]